MSLCPKTIFLAIRMVIWLKNACKGGCNIPVIEDKTKTAVRSGPGVANPISEQPDRFDEVF